MVDLNKLTVPAWNELAPITHAHIETIAVLFALVITVVAVRFLPGAISRKVCIIRLAVAFCVCALLA